MDHWSVGNYATFLLETNITPENGWLEDCFRFGMAYFQGSFQFQGVHLVGKSVESITRKGDTGMNGDLFTCGWLNVSLALSLSSS